MGMIFTSALEMKRRRLGYIECIIPSRGITNKMHVHGKRTISLRKNSQNETLSLVSKLTVTCLMFLHTHFTGLLPSGKTPEKKKEIISMSGRYSGSFVTGPRKFSKTLEKTKTLMSVQRHLINAKLQHYAKVVRRDY